MLGSQVCTTTPDLHIRGLRFSILPRTASIHFSLISEVLQCGPRLNSQHSHLSFLGAECGVLGLQTHTCFKLLYKIHRVSSCYWTIELLIFTTKGVAQMKYISIMWISLGSSWIGFPHLELTTHCQMIIPEYVFFCFVFAVMSQPGVNKFTALPLSNLKKCSVMGICALLTSGKAGDLSQIHRHALSFVNRLFILFICLLGLYLS